MPELPEVETVRRGLEPVLEGAVIARLEQRRPDLRFPFPERFAERLTGRRILKVGRRAKYLVVELDSEDTLIMHLGMSGRFTILPPASVSGSGAPGRSQLAEGAFAHASATDPTHDHLVLTTDAGAVITYNDPRRFGYMQLIGRAGLDTHPLFAGIGPEPLGNAFSANHLASRAAGRTTDLKAFLLDQRNVAGLGNIYVCEALHRASLSPKRAASALARRDASPTGRADRLATAIRDVLRDAIAAGGSTLRDYAHTDGSLGYFQHAFSVYGREGETCRKPGCGGTVKRIVQSGRSTFHCSHCQR